MAADVIAEKVDYKEISCQSCGANLLVEPQMLTAICPYCASPSIIQRPPTENRPTPVFTIGFVVTEKRAVEAVTNWVRRSSLFAKAAFRKAVPELTRGVYLPAYLYNAVAESTYDADIGENYTETETYTTTDKDGKTVTRTRTVVKTEWRKLQGRHVSYILDVVVTASKGVSNPALEAIEPFDLRALRRYTPKMIAGWLAEEPSRTQDECFQFAHGEAVEEVGKKLKGFMPGDSYRNLQYQTNVSQESIDLVLFPIWTFAVRYDESKPPVQILVNGQTGRVGGKVPISPVKVTIAVVIVLLIILAVALLFMAGR